MASKEEDNKLECVSNVNKGQERYFLNAYKKLEFILNNKNESFGNKVESLVEVWKIVGELNLSQFDLHHVIQILDWAKLHALNIVLTAEWNEFKPNHEAKLLEEIARAENSLSKLNGAFATRCKKLADVVRNPWEDRVLMKLMKTKDAEIGPEEIEFFCVETAYLVSVRLKKLCESHCEDLALNLVTAFMNCNKLSKSQNFSVNATESQMWFIFDIYIALLYKFQHRQTIVVLLKELTFDEGLQLVRRFANKRVKISKIWKNCHRVAILGAQMYISQAVVKYTVELKTYLESFLEIYMTLCTKESLLLDFPTSIRRISNLADADGLYLFCNVIQKRAGTELKPFVIELYIRALTTDMNELERQKDSGEPEKAAATTSRLAAAFCNLAEFLDEHVKVARECVLTAFSLEPTKDRMSAIEDLARRSGFQVLDTGQEWKCKLHPPTLPSDEVSWMCPECGDWMCNPDFTAPTKINMALNEALQNSVLGISEALCDDLVVCLSNPRYQILSWFLPWDDLQRLCKMYLNDPQTTKNFVTELKFVDIDYSIFKGIKREPLDELSGIERGYEQYLDHDFVSDNDSDSEDSVSQDSRPYSLGSDGAGEGPYLALPPSSQPKSDPNTLKSLRMFRPNLKRTKDKESSDEISEKLFKSDISEAALQETKKTNIASLSKFLNKVVPERENQAALTSITSSDNSNSCGVEESQSKNVKTATLSLLGGQVAEKETPIIQVPQLLKTTILWLKQPSPKETQLPTSERILSEATTCTMEIKQDLDNLPEEPALSAVMDDNKPSQVTTNKGLECTPCLETKINNSEIDQETQSPPFTNATTIPTPPLPVSILMLETCRVSTAVEESQPATSHHIPPSTLSPLKTSQNLTDIYSVNQPSILQRNIQTSQSTNLNQTSAPLQITLVNIKKLKEPVLNLGKMTEFQSQSTEEMRELSSLINKPPISLESLVSLSQSHSKENNSLKHLVIKESFVKLEQLVPTKEEDPSKNRSEISKIQHHKHLENALKQPLASLEQLVLPKVEQCPNLKSDNQKQTNSIQCPSHSHKLNPQLLHLPLEVKDHPVLGSSQRPSDSYFCLSPNLSIKRETLKNSNLSLPKNSNPLPNPHRLRSSIPTYSFRNSTQKTNESENSSMLVENTMSDIKHHIKHINQSEDNISKETSNQLKEDKHKCELFNMSKKSKNRISYSKEESNQLDIREGKQKLTTNSLFQNIKMLDVRIEIPPLELWREKYRQLQMGTDFSKQHCNKKLVVKLERLKPPLPSPYKGTHHKGQVFQTTNTTKLDQLQIQEEQMKRKRLRDICCSLPKVRKLSQSSGKHRTKTPCRSAKRVPTLPPKQLQEVSVVLDKMSVTKIPLCHLSTEQYLDRIQYRSIPSKDMEWAKWESKYWPGLIQTNMEQPNMEAQQEVSPKPSRFKLGSQTICLEEMTNFYATLQGSIKNDDCFKIEGITPEPEEVSQCNNDTSRDSNMEGVVENECDNGWKNNEYLFEDVSQSELCGSDVEIFSNQFVVEDELEKLNLQNGINCVKNTEQVMKYSEDELPKNLNLTENIRTYVNKSKKSLTAFEDCVNALTGDDELDVCKNVNSIDRIDSHSIVQIGETKPKELTVILYRLPSNKNFDGKCTSTNKEEYPSIKSKCDRGKTPPKNAKRRRSMDKSENKAGKAPSLVQNNCSPLQDANIRVNPRVYSRACCDLNKQKAAVNMSKPMCADKNYVKSVLAKVPGLDNFEMMRPSNVSPIVNVVQISGGRPAQNVPIQNTQTSTQVTPHIQRIGQPRLSDQKPENSSVPPTTTTSTTTNTLARTATTQPSALINILSQQIIRPMSAQTNNTVRRQPPLINILSQQIIRPSTQSVKTVTNSVVPSIQDVNQVKPVVTTTEPIILNQANNMVKTTTAAAKSPNTGTPGQGGTILQFICKSSLPKFQQAFGKTVYQNNSESTDTPSTTVETPGYTNTIDTKPKVVKSVPVNIQPIQGSVIYSRQVPVGQTISLIPNSGTTRQVFRIATSNPEQLSLVKDSVIHSKMSALLAAALQGRPKNADGEIQVVNSDDTKGTITRPTLVQNARIVKPVQLQLQPNAVKTSPQTNLSSTTLEQLREFDMVYKQIKERSSTSTTEGGSGSGESQEVPQQRISVTYVNQLPKYTQLSPVVVVTSYSSLQPAASPALSVTSQGSSSPCVTPASTPTLPKVATKPSSKGKTLKTAPPNNTVATKSSPIPKPQQKPQEDEHTTQRIFDILAEYAEQLRNSPDLNNKPAPRRRSNPPTNPNHNTKRKKSSSNAKKSGQSSSSLDMDTDDITIGSEDSSGGGVLQLSVTDDEQSQAATVNANDSNENSSPPSSRPVVLAEGPAQSRNLIIADSSVGEALKMPNTAVIVPGSYIMPVSMVKGGQQIAVVSGGSKILATVPARSGQNMVFFQSFMNQNRKGAISAVKYSTIQPISGISSQSLAGVSAQPPVILPSTVALGQPLTLKKFGDDREGGELLLTISQQKEDANDLHDIPQPDSSTSVSSDSVDIKMDNSSLHADHQNEKIFHGYQKSVITNSIGTSVIATTSLQPMKEHQNHHIINLNSANNIKVEQKSGERMQSVLVTACSSNGPMLSHPTPRYRKPMEIARTNNNDVPIKEEFLNNGEKVSNEQKTFRNNTTYYVNKMKKINAESQKMDGEMQKQAAIERELRLQKSLSEECEDLGVDEPSTSDLFPEADLLFDSNHSPSYDQTSQDIIKRAPPNSDKEDVKDTMNLFSDDENSSSLRTDLFEYVEYQTVETALNYQARQLINGGNTAVESGSSGCNDNTLLAKCATMSEVTLNSPISPEMYQESSLHKYKFKYSNRKKGEKMRQSDFGGEVVSSSEDTVGSTELCKINCDDENYKVVHVAITKTDYMKEEEKCELHCDDDLDSTSGRGARRSVRKLCSCCNGTQDDNLTNNKKRPPTSRPHTPAAPHKKAFLSKKR